MKFICILLFVGIIVLFLKLRQARQQIEELGYELKRKQEWVTAYEKMYNDLQAKRIFVKNPFFNEGASEYERVEYIPADKIELDCDIERIEREVELNYDFYKKVLDESQVLREQHDKENISYEELAMTSNEAYVCFNQPQAIRGYKEGDTYNLVNGNHRVFLAQKLDIDVPYVILSKGQYITIKELIRSGVLDWNSMYRPATNDLITY